MRMCPTFLRPGRAMGLLLSGFMAAAAWAGEGVTFSDRRSDPRPATTGRTTGRRLTIENPLGSLDPGSSSLQGITAPPFSAPKAVPLSPRERELLQQRRDWIMQSPDNRLGNSDEVNRAFGVRDYKPESSAKDSEKDKDKGTLTRYYEKLESDESDESTPKSPDRPGTENTESLAPFGFDRPPQEFWGSDGYLGSGSRGRGDPMSPRLNDISSGLRSDAFGAAAREAGRWARPFEADRGAGRRQSFSFRDLSATEAAGQPSNVERLLGGSPIDNPVSRGAITSLDPVTAYPDPTREALNPVVAPPVSSLGSPLQAGAAIRDRPLGSTPSSVMRDLGGGALRSTLSPGFSSPGLSERRSLNSIRVNLDTPRRSF